MINKAIPSFTRSIRKSSMSTNFKFKLGASVLFAGGLLLFCQPQSAQAHPQLIGTWKAIAPLGSYMAYAFEPGVYIGGGTWRGPCTVLLGNEPISCGSYELRVLNGTIGTVAVRDGTNQGFITIGNIDIGVNRAIQMKGVRYEPDAPLPVPVPVKRMP
jgi:hypothetical protein